MKMQVPLIILSIRYGMLHGNINISSEMIRSIHDVFPEEVPAFE